jgi:hypothetical protein
LSLASDLDESDQNSGSAVLTVSKELSLEEWKNCGNRVMQALNVWSFKLTKDKKAIFFNTSDGAFFKPTKLIPTLI